MCGIVGYVGTKPAADVLINGLLSVEYRGYDSAGIAVIPESGKIELRKCIGKILALQELLTEQPLPKASIGIGHTRWATHGIPSDRNAHPHCSQDGTVAIVHNGTIENFADLRALLKKDGHVFSSDTDTEVLAHLIAGFQRDGSSLAEAVQKMHAVVTGAYVIAVISTREPGVLVAARSGGPLVLGICDHGYVVASDASSFREHTDRVIYFRDGEMVVIRQDGYSTMTLKNEAITKDVEILTWTLDQISRGGYPHFMLKEICEQPDAVRRTLAGRIDPDIKKKIHLGGAKSIEEFAERQMTNIVIVACGTSWHAGLIAEQLLEKMLGINVRTRLASEFANGFTPVDPSTLVITISQSGETKDTVAAAERAKRHGAVIWNICNVVGSSLTRIADSGVFLHAGPEIGVASTKAFTCQVVAIILTALKLAEIRNAPALTEPGRELILRSLHELPEHIETVLGDRDHVLDIARQFADHRNALYLGRGYNYPAALEGALKLKEISYIHAEGYAAGEMKHGPIALIDKDMPVVVIMPRHGEDESTYKKVRSNVEEVAAREGRVILIASDGDETPDLLRAEGKVVRILRIPQTIPMLAPVLAGVYLQLLAYHIAALRGLPIDQPRNLAKSVTVE